MKASLSAAARLLVDAANAFLDHLAPRMGAALAYYTLFSIAPLLLIAISVAGLVFGEQAARGEMFDQLQGLIGPEGARTLESLLESVGRPGQGLFNTAVGVVLMLVGATTVFAELQGALDRIWCAPPPPEGGGLWHWLRVRLLSIGMVLGIGFLLMVSLLASAALAALSRWAAPWFGDEVLFIAEVLNLVISYGFVITLFAMIYKGLPRVRIAWRDVWLGAAITAALFTFGKWAIGLYIGRAAVASAFGAAGSVVVLMLWIYFSAQIFLFGAEITSIYAHRHGSLRGAGMPLARLEPTAETALHRPGRNVPARPPATHGIPSPPRPDPRPDVVPPRVDDPPVPGKDVPEVEPPAPKPPVRS